MTHWFAPTWLEYMTLASVALACVLNAAVLRDDLIHEDEESATGRRLIVAGMALIALRIGWLIADQVALELTGPARGLLTAYGTAKKTIGMLDFDDLIERDHGHAPPKFVALACRFVRESRGRTPLINLDHRQNTRSKCLGR